MKSMCFQNPLWRKPFSGFLALSLYAFSASLNATDITWDGSESLIWSNPDNWVGGVAPGSSDTAVFNEAVFGVDLNNEAITVGSITANSNLTTGSTGTLTLATGVLTKTSTGRFDINAPLILGANGDFSATEGAASAGIRINGVISDGGNDYSVNATGGSILLYGANTFGGGVTQTGGAVYIQHNDALGTGTFNNVAGDIYVGANTVANPISVNHVTETSLNFRVGSPTSTFGYEADLAGGITGEFGGGNLTFRGNAMTWIFSGGISVTGLSAAGLSLNPEGAGTHTYVFDSDISLAGAITGRIILGSTKTSGGGDGNLLLSEAVDFSGRLLDVQNGGGVDTIGAIHDSGIASYSFYDGVRLFDVISGAVNFASKNSAATTEISSKIDDSVAASAVAVRINQDYQRIDASASVNQSSPVYETISNNGIVNFSSAEGNDYRGGTTVYAGTLLVNNTSNSGTGSGAVEVQSGATLGGAGIVAPTGSHGATFASGSVLAPGNETLGTITFNATGVTTSFALLDMESGSTLSFKLGEAGASDSVDMWTYTSGNVVFNDNVVNVSTLDGVTLSGGEEFTLFTFYSDEGSTMTSSGLTDGLVIGTGLEGFTGSYIDYQSEQIVLVVGSAIPEPSTIAFGLTACLIGLVYGYRRRKNQ